MCIKGHNQQSEKGNPGDGRQYLQIIHKRLLLRIYKELL